MNMYIYTYIHMELPILGLWTQNRRGNGAVSKLELVAAMQNSSRAASYLFPSVNTRRTVSYWNGGPNRGLTCCVFLDVSTTLGWWYLMIPKKTRKYWKWYFMIVEQLMIWWFVRFSGMMLSNMFGIVIVPRNQRFFLGRLADASRS